MHFNGISLCLLLGCSANSDSHSICSGVGVLKCTQVYIGFSAMDGVAFMKEIARWASSTQWATNGGRCPPAIRRRNGSLIETWEDLKGMGFEVRACTCHILFELVSDSLSTQMEVLHSSSFAYNCRVMETRLHREFKESVNRLWSKIGAGSYYLPEKAIQVHNRDTCHLFVLTHDAESARPRVDQQKN